VARKFINTAAGWDLTPDDIDHISQRIDLLGRCVSLREGYHPDKDSKLPQRAFDEPVTNKYGKTWVWKKEEWEEEKRDFFVKALNLSKRGLPLRAELERLGLEYVIPELVSLDAVG